VEAAETDEFTSTLINHVIEIWVEPELQRRGLMLSEFELRKVFVEIEPGSGPRVLLNDEVEFEATFVAKRPIEVGEAITLDDIELLTELHPVSVGPNSGWLAIARLGSRLVISFDFRYNKARSTALLNRAREFLSTAKGAPIAVALDLAFSAAELAVQSQMTTLQSDTRDHKGRARWLAEWAHNANAPQEHAHLLYNLADLRGKARYGDGELRTRPERLRSILKTVESMIESASKLIESNAQGNETAP
jgi:hypothetical protein